MAEKGKEKDKDELKYVARNKKAFFNYEIIDKMEAGIVLQGSEVKSIRNGKVAIQREEFGAKWNQALEAGGWLVGKNVDVDLELQASPPA